MIGRLLLLVASGWLALATCASAQNYQCRTPAIAGNTSVLAKSNVCASEAFITNHFPSSSTAGHVATFADTGGQVLQDGGAPAGGTVTSVGTGQGLSGGPITTSGTLTTGAGVNTNTLKSISGNYPIVSTDAGLTLLWTGSPGTITLPAVSGFDTKASVRVCNGNANDNSHHAATLSGFPPLSFPHLWMQQCMAVAIENGAWQVTQSPGRFTPNFTAGCYVDTGGSNTNDGLVSNASTSAVHDPNQCLNIWQNEMDLDAQQPSILATCNQTNNQDGGAGAFSYAIRPTRVIFFVNNGNCSGNNPIIRNTGGNVVAELADFGGYVIFDGVTLDCTNAASHPCIDLFIHQQNGSDLSTGGFTTGVTFVGAASTDVAVECDSMCKINTGAVVTLSGSFNNGIQLDLGSMFALNSGLTIAASGSISKNIVQVDKSSQFQWSGTLTLGASNAIAQVFEATNGANVLLANNFATAGSALGGGGRQWAILNNALFCNASSTAVPGSAGINSAASWANGIVAASTGGTCFP